MTQTNMKQQASDALAQCVARHLGTLVSILGSCDMTGKQHHALSSVIDHAWQFSGESRAAAGVQREKRSSVADVRRRARVSEASPAYDASGHTWTEHVFTCEHCGRDVFASAQAIAEARTFMALDAGATDADVAASFSACLRCIDGVDRPGEEAPTAEQRRIMYAADQHDACVGEAKPPAYSAAAAVPLYTALVAVNKDDKVDDAYTFVFPGGIDDETAKSCAVAELNMVERDVAAGDEAAVRLWDAAQFDEVHDWTTFPVGDARAAMVACRMIEVLVAEFNAGDVPETVGSLAEVRAFKSEVGKYAADFIDDMIGIKEATDDSDLSALDALRVDLYAAASVIVDAYLAELRRQVIAEKKKPKRVRETSPAYEVPTSRPGGFRTITAGRLRDLLDGVDDDMPVAFACNYGDYHNTQQVVAIEGDADEKIIESSAYSVSRFALVRGPESAGLEDGDPDIVMTVVDDDADGEDDLKCEGCGARLGSRHNDGCDVLRDRVEREEMQRVLIIG